MPKQICRLEVHVFSRQRFSGKSITSLFGGFEIGILDTELFKVLASSIDCLLLRNQKISRISSLDVQNVAFVSLGWKVLADDDADHVGTAKGRCGCYADRFCDKSVTHATCYKGRHAFCGNVSPGRYLGGAVVGLFDGRFFMVEIYCRCDNMFNTATMIKYRNGFHCTMHMH